ncbi:ribosomal-protein-alanine N-acetyltransferase [Glaciihabitans sp. INWT7]|uniref:ribosomal protein S18-alanine N-acetyltransferase n=1 Tax=Glaciihabitans sp. INWT7 TaxID=2596912 RepID=UPI001860D8A5|nr:ribosomal protein S18-alanine N-acetyltransferase [Glaciihabitans sp. INWT7]QNE47907.1 ribosomal-protein-alanine N-acetyltransferase [Glaciihabitans sp. INWT7]
MSWQLRVATTEDLARIMELETGTFGSDAWSSDAMLSDLRNPQCYYLVADRVGFPGELDGYAGLFAPRGALEGDIQTIAVAQTARRGGLGRALMNALIGEARKRGAKEVFLEVRADNPGPKRLYDSLGFEEIAVRVGYYQPDGVDAIVMRLDVPDPVTRPAVGQ